MWQLVRNDLFLGLYKQASTIKYLGSSDCIVEVPTQLFFQ